MQNVPVLIRTYRGRKEVEEDAGKNGWNAAGGKYIQPDAGTIG